MLTVILAIYLTSAYRYKLYTHVFGFRLSPGSLSLSLSLSPSFCSDGEVNDRVAWENVLHSY
jgi:hypothetical protein